MNCLFYSVLTAIVASFPTQGVARATVPVISPNGLFVAYVLRDSLWITNGTRPRAVASGVRGEATMAVPFGSWSPDSKKFAFRRNYDSSGKVFNRGEPVILDIATSSLQRILPDSIDPQTFITFQNSRAGGSTWSPDGRFIAVLGARVGANSDPNSLQLYIYSVADKSLNRITFGSRSVFSASWSPDAKWLAIASGIPGESASGRLEVRDANDFSRVVDEPARDSSAYLRNVLWSPSSTYLLVQDPRQGANIFRFNGNNLIRWKDGLPRGRYIGWLSDDRTLIANSTTDMNSEIVAVDGLEANSRLLTPANENYTAHGIANAQRSNGVISFTRESGIEPPEIWLGILDGKGNIRSRQQMTRLNAGKRIGKVTSTIIHWRRGDGSEGSGQLFLPESTSRPAPLIVVPYGGFLNRFLDVQYFLDEHLYALTHSGWAVVKPNTRGNATDESDIGSYGAPQLQDTELLVRYLAQAGIIDRSRVALYGHSHGGAMTYYYMTHSKMFCAGIAVNGRADWVLQANYPGDGLLPDIMGATPSEDPRLYSAYSPVANAGRGAGLILAVAGDVDNQILPSNVDIMADSSNAAGRAIQAIHFANEGHLIEKPENRAALLRRVRGVLTEACAGIKR